MSHASNRRNAHKASTGLLAAALLLAVAPGNANAAAPSNDNFADRTAIASVPFTTTQSTLDATMEPGERPAACGFDSMQATVWYAFTSPTDAWLEVSTLGSSFDTVVGIWEGGGLGTLTEVACNDDALRGVESISVFRASAGTSYLLQVGGYAGETGDLTLTLGTPTAGSIVGRVTSDSGVGLQEACVDAYDATTFEYISYADTTDSGSYTLAGLPNGSYQLEFLDCDLREDHLGEWYDNQPTQETADAVSVTSPNPTTGIDVVLPAIRLTVSKAGAGGGTITSTPEGIQCGSDCDEVYEHGTRVTLVATPRTDSELAGWTGCDTIVGSQCTLDVFEARAAEARFEIDVTPPQTLITHAPDNPTALSNATFDFVASEPGSTFECSLDGAAFSACTSPKTYSGLANGSHTFEVRATDAAGNTDLSPAAFGWTIDTTAPDTTPPQTTITSGPSGMVTSSTAAFGFVASEPGSTFACSLDGSAFAACSSPHSYGSLAEGSHTFQVEATDAAGNADPSPATATWVVDAAGPAMALQKPMAGVYANDQRLLAGGPASIVIGYVTVEVSAADRESGVANFRYEVDGKPVSPSAVTEQGGVYRFTFRPSAPGEYTIAAFATNGSGITSSLSMQVQGIPTG